MILPSKITPELAEETGGHIGDGSMNFYNNRGKQKGIYQLRGHIEDDRLHYIKRIKPIFKSLFNLDINLRKMPSTRVFGFQVWNCDLVKFKQFIGLPFGKKSEIFIPEIFLKNRELKKAVIRGIFDTDGGVYLETKNNKLYPINYITTISKALSNQIYNILQELKIHSTITNQLDRRGNRKRVYRINIRGLNQCNNFMKLVQPKNTKFIEKYGRILHSKGL